MELEDNSGSRAATSAKRRDTQDLHRHVCADPQPSTARDFRVRWGRGSGQRCYFYTAVEMSEN